MFNLKYLCFEGQVVLEHLDNSFFVVKPYINDIRPKANICVLLTPLSHFHSDQLHTILPTQGEKGSKDVTVKSAIFSQSEVQSNLR